jgi:AcrR family transcriptional regulator
MNPYGTRIATDAATRRTQAERTADTTQRLLDATLETLAEHGYRGTTTSAVAARAGVSRGAMLHHFPNRNSLLAAAAEWMMESRIREFRVAMSEIDDSSDRIRAAIDLLWKICSSTTYVAWTDLALAARNEPELAAPMAKLEVQARLRIHETWAETFPEVQKINLAGVAPDFALSLLEGLALRQLLSADTAAEARVIDALKDIATLLFSDPPMIPSK